ncbi:unnamed protein product [Chironomus riparius]|uniref:Uncharacterized protein n=1 Tax=Chironomus riparius TaxID=315576 RepID=A0A9N9WMW3_9DIPT|nr:unnamed protein product [Chironomus riparius]
MKKCNIYFMLEFIGCNFTIWIPKADLCWNLKVKLLCSIQDISETSLFLFTCCDVVNFNFSQVNWYSLSFNISINKH